MNIFILIRKKQKKAVWVDSKEMLFDYIDDIHNICFKSVKIAQKYVAQMKPEAKEGVYIVRLKLDPLEEKPIITPKELLEKEDKPAAELDTYKDVPKEIDSENQQAQGVSNETNS